MADKRKGGRYTPKGGGAPSAGGRARKADADAADDATPQVGKRPSNPALLFGIAAMWIVVGVVIGVSFSASWKLVPAIVAVGIGLFFLRGALTTVVRQDERLSDRDG